MYSKAKRRLIRLRQPHSKMNVEAVGVQRVSGGQEGRCFDNARLFCANNSQYDIVSGWFVNRWDKNTNSCLILAHYWNVGQCNDYIDSTPLHDFNGVYVIDREIGIYANLHKIKLFSVVCTSILFEKNAMSGVDMAEGGMEVKYRTLDDLSAKSLFVEIQSS